MKKNILTLFGFNIEMLPDGNFIEGSMVINHRGVLIKDYSKIFEDKTYFLFDTIEIKVFTTCSNVFFISHKLQTTKLSSLKKLINDLYKIYGFDEFEKGSYCAKDIVDFKNKEVDFYFVRHWKEDIESGIIPCNISIDRELNSLILTIYGVGLFKNKNSNKKGPPLQ